MPTVFCILGIMTGTSCDGLDAACMEFSKQNWRLLWADQARFPSGLRKRVLEIQTPGCRIDMRELLRLDRDLGTWYGSNINTFLKRHRNKRPDVIANHGQTVAHFPEANGKGTTLQLGDPARICFETGLTVLSDFRAGDIAAHGEGAPLVPLFHREVCSALGLKSGVAVHNIGGISNLTYIGTKNQFIAFDTGPGNCWIDEATSQASQGKACFDHNGSLAAQGRVDRKAVQRILKFPYFHQRPPKSTGRNQFPFDLLLKHTQAQGLDLIATATAVTVESIANQYKEFILPSCRLTKILVCGGGAENKTLVRWLTQALPCVSLTPVDELGINGQNIEAQAFAYLGFRTLHGLALGGSWTGAKAFGPPASITPGKNWKDLVRRLFLVLK